MAFSVVLSAGIRGMHVELVHVEADISNGLPVFHMVGYLSSEVKEAAERVRTAIRNADIVLPAKKIMVNLAPATMRKKGASYDLPIALAVLASLGAVSYTHLDVYKRQTMNEFIWKRTKRRPMILPIIMDV